MARANWLANKLREYGCTVVEVDGWTTRGSSTFNPQAVVLHHTASRAGGDAPSLGICIRGRSDLPGPLCNVLISRSGVCYVIASGRANHAGKGGFRGLTGNSSVFGIEVENNGVGEPWRPTVLDAFQRCNAAMLDGISRDSSWVVRHADWATPKGRKIDPAGIDMGAFLHAVATHLGKKPAPAPQPPRARVWKEGDRGPEVKSIQNICNFWGWNAGTADGIWGPRTTAGVKRAQKALGVAQDGIWGPATEAAYVRFRKAMEALSKVSRPTLKQGDRGEHVRYLQQRLNAHGIKVEVDGIFGPRTLRAVLLFQTHKTGADGIVGPVTWRLLG